MSSQVNGVPEGEETLNLTLETTEETGTPEEAGISEKGVPEQPPLVETAETSDESLAQQDVQEQAAKTYTEEQVNAAIQGRLIRAERNFQKELAAHAGVVLEAGESAEALKLWGFMKLNPQLSEAVQTVIDTYLNQGNAVLPQKAGMASDALSLREAIVDLKEQDPFFAKHSKDILAWAEDSGYEVTNSKTLKMAILAWKGENAPKQIAQAQLNAQKKAQQKQDNKKAASLEGGTAPRSSGAKLDYSKATDREILQHEGLSLFIE